MPAVCQQLHGLAFTLALCNAKNLCMKTHSTKVSELLNLAKGWTLDTWGPWGNMTHDTGQGCCDPTRWLLLTVGSQQDGRSLPIGRVIRDGIRMRGSRQTPFLWLYRSIISHPQYCTPKSSGNRKIFHHPLSSKLDLMWDFLWTF